LVAALCRRLRDRSERPLTVFAPTNAAFEALPPGTVGICSGQNVDKLREC
jgi:uncharacterized surface protein with fasciclin (FAS1) repeats